MFTQLQRQSYDLVREIFDDLAINVEVPSILDGNTRGAVYVDDLRAPATALIWDQLAALFLAGRADNPTFNEGMRCWLADSPFTLAQDVGIAALTVTYAPAVWASHLPDMLSDLRLTEGLRRYYRHTGEPVEEPEVPEGFITVPVTRPLLERASLPGMNWLKGWILSYWPTIDDFLDLGFGYVSLSNDESIVSLCLSVFVSGRAYEFGTATHEPHRRRGLSTSVASACVNESLARGLEPIWHCWSDNVASRAVARKVGFELERHYPVFRLWVPEHQVTG